MAVNFEVQVAEGPDALKRALRKLQRGLGMTGVLGEVRRRQFACKPSEKRRDDKVLHLHARRQHDVRVPLQHEEGVADLDERGDDGRAHASRRIVRPWAAEPVVARRDPGAPGERTASPQRAPTRRGGRSPRYCSRE